MLDQRNASESGHQVSAELLPASSHEEAPARVRNGHRVLSVLQGRFPSVQETMSVLMACAFPVCLWSIVSVLRQVPAWGLRMSVWELIGVVAYTQAFALLESVLVLFGLFLLALILPAQFFRVKFVALGTMIVFATTTWAIIAHYNSEAIGQWGMRAFLPWVTAYAVSLSVLYWLVHRYEKLEKALVSFVGRLTVLSSVYIAVGVSSVVIVIVRNIK